MSSTESSPHNAGGSEPVRKSPYHPPKLVNYGLIRELTKGLSGTASEASAGTDMMP